MNAVREDMHDPVSLSRELQARDGLPNLLISGSYTDASAMVQIFSKRISGTLSFWFLTCEMDLQGYFWIRKMLSSNNKHDLFKS